MFSKLSHGCSLKLEVNHVHLVSKFLCVLMVLVGYGGPSVRVGDDRVVSA
jgi:hypothetical protein